MIFFVSLKRLFYLVLILTTNVCFADIVLPLPQNEGGIGLFDALKKRSSTQGGKFTPSLVIIDELSTVLWSATGVNRGQSGLTVPMYLGLKPYVKIYVTGIDGTFLYHPEGHFLQKIVQKDLRGDIALQTFVKRAYYSLIFVSDESDLLKKIDQELARDFISIAVGAMSQNVYLVATSLKLDVRYIHSIKHQKINEHLNLSSHEKPIGIMLLSK